MKRWTTDEGYEIVEAPPYYVPICSAPWRKLTNTDMGAFEFHMQEDMRPAYLDVPL